VPHSLRQNLQQKRRVQNFSLQYGTDSFAVTMKKIFQLAIAVVLVVANPNCTPAEVTFPQENERKVIRQENWQITIQPYEKTTIKINQNKIAYRITSKDKTMATVHFLVPVYEDSLGFVLTLENPGYRKTEKRILRSSYNEKYKEIILKNPDYYFSRSGKAFYGILDKENSMLHFHSYHKMGSQPKAVGFIKNNEIVMPLLSDKGADVVNIETGTRKRISPPATYAKLTGFVEVLLLPEKNEFWISQMMNNSVHAFDLGTYTYKGTVIVQGKWSKVLGYNPVDKRVYLSNWSSANISAIDSDQKKFLFNVPTGGIPRGMAFSDDGKFMYAAQFSRSSGGNDIAGKVLKISLDTKKIVKQIGPPGAKRHIVKSKKHRRLFVSDLGKRKVDIVDLDKDEFVKSIPVYSSPNTIVLSHDERYLFVSCRGPNNPKGYHLKGYYFGQIYVIDAATLEIVEFIEGGNQPTGLDISPDDRYLVFSDFLDNAVRVYRLHKPDEKGVK